MNHTLKEKLIESIKKLIAFKFDSIALSFLGIIPTQNKEKNIVFKTSRSNLMSLFLQALGSREPNRNEESALKVLLSVANNYLNAVKEKTTARVVDRVSSELVESQIKQTPISLKKINKIIALEMDKTTNSIKTIINAESNKAVNVGTALQISKVAESQNIDDPTVFFIVIDDDRTGFYEYILHLLPDRKTPRVWKLSEVQSDYYTPGGQYPSLAGLHPNCFTGSQLLFTQKGLISFKDLYDSQEKPNVLVDYRIKNRKEPANQFGEDIPGNTWLHAHSKQKDRFLKSTAVYDTGIQEVLRITLKGGQQKEVTLNHECWVEIGNTKWSKKTAKDLKVGDKLPLNTNAECFGEDHFPEIAELMGNLLGDGTINEKTGWCVWNFFGDDIEYGKELIKKRDLVTHSKYKHNRPIVIKPHEQSEKYNVDKMSMSSCVFGRLIQKEFGFSKKPRRVPNRLFCANKETVTSFLRGLYAADGHSEKNTIVLAQNDYEFLKQIQLLLSMCGFVSSIYKHGSATTKTIKYSNGQTYKTTRKACWRLVVAGYKQHKRFIENIGFGVPKKQKRAVANCVPHKARRNSRKTGIIEKIENIGPQQTYCLTEPMANTVTVNSIVTGQCRCKLTYLSPGYGFKDGKVAFIGLDHDEFKAQRAQYGLPSVPSKATKKNGQWVLP